MNAVLTWKGRDLRAFMEELALWRPTGLYSAESRIWLTSSDLDSIFDELFPICRSITGDGLRKSLSTITRYIPLSIEGVRSGTGVFDWQVPQEWNIRTARLSGPNGRVIADFAESNLRVVNYSVPVDVKLPLDELQPHLHSLLGQPHLVPYVTSYYKRDWGFCLTQNEREALEPGIYHAFVEADFSDGEVNFATALLSGESKREFLLGTYFCHPSMANNELSGPLVLIGLYDRIKQWKRRRFTYRFVINPETIGSICYLYHYGNQLLSALVGGFILTCLGGPNETLSIKLTRDESAQINQLAKRLNEECPRLLALRDFDPSGGSDERQYCSPGFNLPVAQIARTVYGGYPEYHTSGDDKQFMRIDQIVDSINRIENILLLWEESGYFVRTNPFCEPQLGKRGLYPNLNSPNTWGFSSDTLADHRTLLRSIQYLLNYADGSHSLIDIARKSNDSLERLRKIVLILEEHKLVTFSGASAT